MCPLKSQTDLTDLYLGKRLAFFDGIIEIDAAKVRTYEIYDKSCNTHVGAALVARNSSRKASGNPRQQLRSCSK